MATTVVEEQICVFVAARQGAKYLFGIKMRIATCNYKVPVYTNVTQIFNDSIRELKLLNAYYRYVIYVSPDDRRVIFKNNRVIFTNCRLVLQGSGQMTE